MNTKQKNKRKNEGKSLKTIQLIFSVKLLIGFGTYSVSEVAKVSLGLIPPPFFISLFK